MKSINGHIIKDLAISVLIVICIAVAVVVIFYNKIALSKVIPESEEYFLTEEMEQEIEDTKLEEAEEIVVNYYIDAADLKKYEATNEYNKGKKNPFGVEETPPTNTDDTNLNNNSSSSNNNSSNFYEDDGTK